MLEIIRKIVAEDQKPEKMKLPGLEPYQNGLFARFKCRDTHTDF